MAGPTIGQRRDRFRSFQAQRCLFDQVVNQRAETAGAIAGGSAADIITGFNEHRETVDAIANGGHNRFNGRVDGLAFRFPFKGELFQFV